MRVAAEREGGMKEMGEGVRTGKSAVIRGGGLEEVIQSQACVETREG